MNAKLLLMAGTTVMLFAGCATPLPPGAERGPDGTMAYDVLVEASAPGVRIEANGESIGEAPVHLKIYGDPDGTFHDFGGYYYGIRAFPPSGMTNLFVQTRIFQTGHMFSPEDRIPERIYFDMTQRPATYLPYPVYVYPPSYNYYYGPGYYYGWSFWGPSFRFDMGPHYYHGYRGHSYDGHHR